MLENIRSIGLQSLDMKGSSSCARVMKRILKLFRRAAQSPSPTVRETFDIPQELLSLIEHISPDQNTDKEFSPDQLEIINFFAESAEPEDLLIALGCSSLMTGFHPEILPIVQTILRRAAHESGSSELSVALLKVKHARMDIEDKIETKGGLIEDRTQGSCTIWQNMSNAMITIAK